jgi:hypothetical protein
MTYNLTKLETKQATGIGSVSCVGGIPTERFPRNHGNYFGVTTSDGGYEVFNMYYEDLEHLIKMKVVEFPIQIKVLEKHWCAIYDSRIPKEYLSESYRAPEKYWSMNKRIERQLKIDSGEIKIIGDNIEVHNIPKKDNIPKQDNVLMGFRGEVKMLPPVVWAPWEIIFKDEQK